MITLVLVVLAWLAQGIPVAPNQSGTVLGTLRTAAGTPVAGVRVSALGKPENTMDLATSNSMAGLAETDAAGRFRLENIPPGRYYIVAGNIDVPTFFPGTITANEAKDILIAP